MYNLICSFNFLILLAVFLNIYAVINIKVLENSNQQIQSYKFTSHIAAFLSVVLITEMLEIGIQTSYNQNVQLILKSYLPGVLGTTLNSFEIETRVACRIHLYSVIWTDRESYRQTTTLVKSILTVVSLVHLYAVYTSIKY
jgi:hypothetical protein